VNPSTLNTLRAAEEAVTRLIERCRKPGPLYRRSPKAAAQVNRTSKWLLNAIAALHRELKKPAAPEDQAAG
jgi:hypothetical protein